MKTLYKLAAFALLIGPIFPAPAAAFTVVGGSSPNAYMVENTTGTSPSGAACYEFQTRPTCGGFINGIVISTGNFGPGSTSYIQNTPTPNTTTQIFSVSSGTVTGNFTAGIITTTKTIQQGDGTNTGVGINAINAITSGTNNSGFGLGAGSFINAGINNSAFGNSALISNTSGGNNTAIGYTSLGTVVSGSSNTAVGYNAGHNELGNQNVYIGANSGPSASATLTNSICIGSNCVAASSNTMQLGGSGGNAVTVVGSTLTFSSGTITTFNNHLNFYRRPNLVYNSGTVVNVESGITGTSSQVLIIFPDGEVRVDSTANHYNCDLSRVFSGSQSGIFSGTVAINTWYAIYATKTASPNVIITVATTTLPTQSNYSLLNTQFGANGWIYLGLVRNGNNGDATTGIISFVQSGNMTIFNVGTFVSLGIRIPGTMLADTAGATSVTYTYSSGTGTTDIPSNITQALYFGGAETGGTGFLGLQTPAGLNYVGTSESALNRSLLQSWVPASSGIKLSGVASTAKSISIGGFIDGVLGVGSNPQL
jgi:hypothetical protein